MLNIRLYSMLNVTFLPKILMVCIQNAIQIVSVIQNVQNMRVEIAVSWMVLIIIHWNKFMIAIWNAYWKASNY